MSNDRSIWFVRHTQSKYNEKKLFTGWDNPGLTEKGIQQAYELKDKLKEIKFNKMFCSPLERAMQTMRIITQDNFIVDDRLKERDYGHWAGKSKTEIRESVGEDLFFSARRGWDTPPPNGECLHDVMKRVKSFLEELPKKGQILVVSHGNTIRAISVYFGINTTKDVSAYEIKVGTHLLIEK